MKYMMTVEKAKQIADLMRMSADNAQQNLVLLRQAGTGDYNNREPLVELDLDVACGEIIFSVSTCLYSGLKEQAPAKMNDGRDCYSKPKTLEELKVGLIREKAKKLEEEAVALEKKIQENLEK